MRIVVALAVLNLCVSSVSAEEPDVLSQQARCEFVDTPLDKALESLAAKHNVTILLNKKMLKGVGIPADEPINVILNEVTLKTVLSTMLSPLGLATVAVADDQLEVTTFEDSRSRLTKRKYELRPITGLQNEDREKVASAIMKATGGSWMLVDGLGGSLEFEDNAMIVNQTTKVHSEIANLLAQMTRIVNPQKAPPLTKQEQRELAIHKALQQPRDIKLIEVPLTEMADSLGKTLKVSVLIDVAELTRAGRSTETPVIAVGSAMPTSQILDEVLQPLKLNWFIEDEVIKITNREDAEDHRVARVYDIRSLRARPVTERNIYDDVQSIPGLLWETIDGIGGTIQILDGMLIVRQNRTAHEQIADLLTRM